jgi:hypothetical protein
LIGFTILLLSSRRGHKAASVIVRHAVFIVDVKIGFIFLLCCHGLCHFRTLMRLLKRRYFTLLVNEGIKMAHVRMRLFRGEWLVLILGHSSETFLAEKVIRLFVRLRHI